MLKFNNLSFKEYKQQGKKISMLTAYDYYSASFVEKAGVDTILVGDSLGMVIQGFDTTVGVKLEDIIYHTKCVRNGAKNTFIIADMPFLTYNVSMEESLKNAGRLIQEAGADAVKLEGGIRSLEVIKKLIDLQIPVIGHIGLTPQSINLFGGFKVQAKVEEDIKNLFEDALALEEAGVSAIVLECVPKNVAAIISSKLSIPTIGIGAGSGCDGQVLVYHDMLGITTEFNPKFVKRYSSLADNIVSAIKSFDLEVKNASFPTDSHSFNSENKNLDLEKIFYEVKEN